LSLTLEETQLQAVYYIHSVEIPTNKGANSYTLKLSKTGIHIANKRIT